MIQEAICPKCGKLFCPAPQHIYKDTKGKYCSWTCFNHRNDGKKNASCKSVVKCDESGREIERFSSAGAAAIKTGLSVKCIRDACRQNTKYNGYAWKYEEG